MLQVLSCSYSQHHRAVEEIYRRCLSIGALPLPFSSSFFFDCRLSLALRVFFSTFSFVTFARHAQNQFVSTLHDSEPTRALVNDYVSLSTFIQQCSFFLLALSLSLPLQIKISTFVLSFAQKRGRERGQRRRRRRRSRETQHACILMNE